MCFLMTSWHFNAGKGFENHDEARFPTRCMKDAWCRCGTANTFWWAQERFCFEMWNENKPLNAATLIKNDKHIYPYSVSYSISSDKATSTIILTRARPQISVKDCVGGRRLGTTVIRTRADASAAQLPVDLHICTHIRIHRTVMHGNTCTHTVGILHTPAHLPLLLLCPWAWQSGHGRYQRGEEAWKQRPRLWVRSACSWKSAFVGDKMAMSEQLETDGGRSPFFFPTSFFLCSLLMFSLIQQARPCWGQTNSKRADVCHMPIFLIAHKQTNKQKRNVVCPLRFLSFLTLTKVNWTELHLWV